MQVFCVKSTLPSAAVPWPGGSPAPVGLIVISWASSAAVGARPTPYVCASAALVRSSKIGTILSEPIGHAPVAGGSPLVTLPSLAIFQGIMVLLFMGGLNFGV